MAEIPDKKNRKMPNTWLRNPNPTTRTIFAINTHFAKIVIDGNQTTKNLKTSKTLSEKNKHLFIQHI